MHRLAAGNVPPGASSPRTQKSFQTDVSPGGYSSLARRFLEISRNTEFHEFSNIQASNSIIHQPLLSNTKKNNRVQLP